MQLGI